MGDKIELAEFLDYSIFNYLATADYVGSENGN